MPDLTSYLGKINQQPTLHDKHFCKKTRISLIKKPKKNTCKSKYSNNLNVERNVVLFYANLKRKHHLSTHKVSFPEQAKLFGHFCKEYSGLSNVENTNIWKCGKQRRG